MDVDATAGSDYVAKMQDLKFAAGQYRKSFAVTINRDGVAENDEQFMVMLSLVSGPSGTTVSRDTGYATIVNDDTNAAITTESFLVGPFNLSALGTGAGSESDTSGFLNRPAGSFAIKNMTFEMVDANGAQIDMMAVHLHHIVLLDWSKSDSVCPSYPSRFTGAGKEKTPMVLGDDYAYKVNATDQQWSAQWHVMNMSAQSQTVYIKYNIGYVAYNSPLAAKNVTPYWYDVTGPCTDSQFNVPGTGGSGSVYTKSRTFTAPHAGTRVGVGGHLHDGGIDITMKRTPSNQVICANTAVYGMPGMIHSITACTDYTSVAAGEQFTTTARYDNSAPLSGVMGIQLNYVYEG